MMIDQGPATKEVWGTENMRGRLGRSEEFRGLALPMMSEGSSFMTGTTVVCDVGAYRVLGVSSGASGVILG
ncbi:uncharacterized protein BO72DRAFT_260906, partial [Aspergillus fijiensis CBS 313.89]